MPRSRFWVGSGVLGLAHHLVELDPERTGHQAHGVTEDSGAGLGHRRERRVIEWSGEPDRKLGLGRVVARGVHRLGDRDGVDSVADVRRHDAEEVGQTRVHAGAEERTSPTHAGIDESSRSAPKACPVMNAAVVTTLIPVSKYGDSSSTTGHFGL